MTEHSDNSESERRNLQIKKLLEAIANYNPTPEQLFSMDQAKKEMVRNIQKKYNLSMVNNIYAFPLQLNNEFDDEGDSQYEEIENLCVLQNQNLVSRDTQKSKSKYRKPLEQRSSNKSDCKIESIKKMRESFKTKEKDQTFINSIQKAIKSGLKCQTPKVIKKEIVLTKKIQMNQSGRIQLSYTGQQQNQQMNSCSSMKSKLKIKKPNTYLNEAKKHIHLRTQNNINFKPYHERSASNNEFERQNGFTETNLFNHEGNQEKFVISEEPSEQSLFFNSRTNQNIDENTNFQYPKPIFNVSDLKEKLRQTSKSNKKDFNKRHKRTATEGGCSQIKIKLFSNSFKKNSCQKNQIPKKILCQSSLFKKSQKTHLFTNIMNRTTSSLSQHSLKKGIKICRKIDENNEESQPKDLINTQKSLPKQQKKYTISKICKGNTDEMPFQKEKIKVTSSHSFLVKDNFMNGKNHEAKFKKSESKDKKGQKQNVEINKVSKLNSIMTSLKEEYKVKNGAKPQIGLKTTVCR